MTPKVWNMRDPNIPAAVVYVGRPTKWGNPFKIGQPDPINPKLPILDREGVIRHYTAWLKGRPDLQRAAQQELRGRDLGCWCAPLPCHAGVLLEIANT